MAAVGLASPLEGFPHFLPPPGGFGGLGPGLAGLSPLAPWHVEAGGSLGGGEGGGPRAGRLLVGGGWGEEAPVGGHVVGGRPFEDAVEEVLQVCGVAGTRGVLRRRPGGEDRGIPGIGFCGGGFPFRGRRRRG